MAIYNGKHCVFEQVGVDDTGLTWNAENNKDDEYHYNNWDISTMRNTTLPARLLLLSNSLQENLSNTTIQTAKNGGNSTLVSTSNKLFLPAEKEMSSTNTYSVSQEFSALTTWNYWVNHTQASDRIKYDSSSTARSYWLRSPRSLDSNYVVCFNSIGNASTNYVLYESRISPCFAF